jgi:hypothetical protein
MTNPAINCLDIRNFCKPETFYIYQKHLLEAELTNRLIKTIWFLSTAMDKAA